ncbi:unknown [Candidatus Colimorpha enterica]|uniref:Uncharacterized protein n=1 Tax=Candidatus Colimorpha enterica TaxID=3083063 RepID=R6TI03_9BACT|nr:unknown [Candidatus Colimorpha enterica]
MFNSTPFFDEICNKWGDSLSKYDLCNLSALLEQAGRKRQYIAKIIKSKTAEKTRCEVSELSTFASPEFLDAFGYQIQSEIERQIGYKDIHLINKTMMIFKPFFAMLRYDAPDLFYFTKQICGVRYTYAECSVLLIHKDFPAPFPTFWFRFHCKNDPEREIKPEERVTPDQIVFEICDSLPDGLPPYEKLPSKILNEIEEVKATGIGAFEYGFEKNMYNPNLWKEQIKSFLDRCTEDNNRRAQRQKNKNRAKRDDDKFPLIVCPRDDIDYPDVTIAVEFYNAVSDGLIGELNDSVDEFDEALEDCHLEYYSVDKPGDRTCEITVDFGMCHPSAVMRLVKAICMDVAGIKTITID